LNKIKILHTIRQADFGGGETHLRYLINNLDKRKFESIILTFAKGSLLTELMNKGMKTYCLESQIPFDFRLRNKINSIIAEEQIDIIHAHGTKGASNVVLCAAVNNLPLIYTVHGWSTHKGIGKINLKIRQRIEAFLCKKADRIICVSKANYNSAPVNDKTNFTVIYNGIDTEKFCVKNRNKVREELSIERTTFVIGFLARLTHQKDPLTLLKAFKSLADKNNDIQLLIVGEGELRNEVVKFINKNHLNEKVIILPYRSDIAYLLNAIDCYILPSLWEGLPYGLLEAMSVGIPSIASNVDGNSEIIDDNVNGFLIKPYDYKKIVSLVERIRIDNNFYSYISTNGRHTIVSKFNLKQMISKTEDVYFKMMINKKSN